jgi:outer membrane immunogenic protein
MGVILRSAKFISLAAVAVSAVIGIGAASAADLPVRIYTKAPAVAVPVYDWAGFYAGINGGYGWTARTSDITYYGIDPGGPFLANRDRGFNANGVFGGLQIGYNWQRDRLVFGIEGDFELSAIKDRFTQIVGPAFDFERDTFLGKMNVNYFGTVRGRLGYSLDRSLVYVTGGFAFADIDQRQDSIPPPDRLALGAVPVFREQNGIRTGYVVGAGIEHKFDPSWSLKGEYQYLNFGSDPLNGVVPGAPVILTTSGIANSFHTIRVGLNYHFYHDYVPTSNQSHLSIAR